MSTSALFWKWDQPESEQALKLALAGMRIWRVWTRRAQAITQHLCGFEVSWTQVTQATAALDEQLKAWRMRPLGRRKYLFRVRSHSRVPVYKMALTGSAARNTSRKFS